jgi:2-C-methyl-D-erythritol 2,4-cyclodiphosphate synthase
LISDTVYVSDENGFAVECINRERLRAAQTPQGFTASLAKEAHERALDTGLPVTDDGMPVLLCGREVELVPGDSGNIKITTQEDIAVAQAIRRDNGAHDGAGGGGMFADIEGSGMCVGIGFDAHRFCEGRPLVLGGLAIPFEKGLLGHSDADVLTHALMDAILGALHEGDIGKMFPDSDPVYEGADSVGLLREIVGLMDSKGYTLVNADMTIVAEKPKMEQYRGNIERNLAAALGTEAENVSLKATTTEKLGFTGREEGIAAEAIVLLKTKEKTK